MCVTGASLKYELQLASEAEADAQQTLSESYASLPQPAYVPSSPPRAPSPTTAPPTSPDSKPVPIVWPQPSRLRGRRNRGRQYKEPEDEPELNPSGKKPDLGAIPFTCTPTTHPATLNQTPGHIGQVQGNPSQSQAQDHSQIDPRVQKWMSRAEVLAGSAGLSPSAIAMARRTAEAQLTAAAAQMSSAGVGVDPEKAFAQISKETDKLAAQFKEMGGSAFAQFARTAGPLSLNGLSPDQVVDGVRQAAGPVLAEVAQITRSNSGSKFRKSAKQVAATLKDAARPALAELTRPGSSPKTTAKVLDEIKGPAIAAGSLLAAAAQGARSSKSFGKLGLAAGLIGGLVTAGTAMYVQHKQEKQDKKTRQKQRGGGDNNEEDEDEGYSESMQTTPRKGQTTATTHERVGLPVHEFSSTDTPILYLHV